MITKVCQNHHDMSPALSDHISIIKGITIYDRFHLTYIYIMVPNTTRYSVLVYLYWHVYSDKLWITYNTIQCLSCTFYRTILCYLCINILMVMCVCILHDIKQTSEWLVPFEEIMWIVFWVGKYPYQDNDHNFVRGSSMNLLSFLCHTIDLMFILTFYI